MDTLFEASFQVFAIASDVVADVRDRIRRGALCKVVIENMGQ